ncbi:hypothetical protein Pmar_PMAR006996 [Perkinsus marinus ATCC 50983]|uniref:RNA-editing substrate-binding complex 6 protein domain-containing protein n=1 Tax=Perkinsus marinus (strain ATCC 50983 / TXsc) TaxID=423536 RepID=C5KK06_PERM5|nr:hypothetical protein Pmar_PMAR006996 [Perkinsus marinus ATCC 50983]EER15264.1 hypothetical protein Pmar_PMAR006996 [Perkinsus marinus ATCC 50983]|eukprot:XP_002783468.1 hypothetical protein Pmar_PMAR006996 [Perkinsus marinus ATCC 50983]
MIFDTTDLVYYLISIPLTLLLCRLLVPSLTTTRTPSLRVPEVDVVVESRTNTGSNSVKESVETAREHQPASENTVTETNDNTARVNEIAAAIGGTSRVEESEEKAMHAQVPPIEVENKSIRKNTVEQQQHVVTRNSGEVTAQEGGAPGLVSYNGTVVTRHNYNQPTPNEFEIQKSILVAANARSVKGLLEIVDTHVTQLNSVNVSTLIHRLASITQNHEQSQKALTRDHRMKKVLRRAVELARISSCQSLSNISWAVGKLQLSDEKEVVEAIVGAAKTRLEHFRPQNFSNMLYGLSRVNHYDKALMEMVAKRVLGTIHNFKPQEVSNLLYAYGRLNCFHEELLKEICDCVAILTPHYDGHGIGNIMCSLARLNYPDKKLMDIFEMASSN